MGLHLMMGLSRWTAGAAVVIVVTRMLLSLPHQRPDSASKCKWYKRRARIDKTIMRCSLLLTTWASVLEGSLATWSMKSSRKHRKTKKARSKYLPLSTTAIQQVRWHQWKNKRISFAASLSISTRGHRVYYLHSLRTRSPTTHSKTGLRSMTQKRIAIKQSEIRLSLKTICSPTL